MGKLSVCLSASRTLFVRLSMWLQSICADKPVNNTGPGVYYCGIDRRDVETDHLSLRF